MRRIAVLLVSLLVPFAAACGGDGDEEAGGEPLQTIEISETEFALDPHEVTLDEAGTYTFNAVNDGEATHALEIEGGGIEEETEEIGPGESAELTVELAEGEYKMYCPVGNHEAEGMVGHIAVGGGAAGGGGETETDEMETGETETETGETETGETETDESPY